MFGLYIETKTKSTKCYRRFIFCLVLFQVCWHTQSEGTSKWKKASSQSLKEPIWEILSARLSIQSQAVQITWSTSSSSVLDLPNSILCHLTEVYNEDGWVNWKLQVLVTHYLKLLWTYNSQSRLSVMEQSIWPLALLKSKSYSLSKIQVPVWELAYKLRRRFTSWVSGGASMKRVLEVRLWRERMHKMDIYTRLDNAKPQRKGEARR